MELLVNFYPLLLIFAVSLIVHLLISRLTVICEAVSDNIDSEPSDSDSIRCSYVFHVDS